MNATTITLPAGPIHVNDVFGIVGRYRPNEVLLVTQPATALSRVVIHTIIRHLSGAGTDLVRLSGFRTHELAFFHESARSVGDIRVVVASPR